MAISEAPPSSSDDTPSISNGHSKSNCSLGSLGAHFKGKGKGKGKGIISEPKLIENKHNVASSSATNNNDDDDHAGALALSKLIHQDLISIQKDFEDAKEYMDWVNVQINQAFVKFEELQTRGSKGELDELKKALAKLKSRIPSVLKIHSVDSNKHHNPWPDVNKASNEMIHYLYKEPKFEPTIDSEGLLKAFINLPQKVRHCLLSFLRFPEMAIIKRRVIIYVWIGEGYLCFMCNTNEEDKGNEILDEFIAKGFIEPIYQKCSLVPDSCRMGLSVRSALLTEVEGSLFIKYYTLGQDFLSVDISPELCKYLINIGEAIIDGGPELFEEMERMKILYLGRWQSSTTYAIVVADIKIFHGLKNMNCLSFLSLQGISEMTELPSIIAKIRSLKILDLRACYHLEVLPKGIGSLNRLTHLDMSECYFLEYMPKSLSNLYGLQVLKGFFVGHSKYNKQSCTLDDLSKLPWLRKLNICTSVKYFPTETHLHSLQKLEALRKLTISWAGESLQGENNANSLKRLLTSKTGIPPPALPSKLQKLDLQCFHGMSPPSWLRPANLKELKKLYIRGGKLRDLGQFQKLNDEHQWTVEILRFKYLGELEMDWAELRILFPKLFYLHKMECPKLTNFPCDESGVWIDKKAIDQAQPGHEQVQ